MDGPGVERAAAKRLHRLVELLGHDRDLGLRKTCWAARVLDALAIPHQLATASADLPESSAPVVDMRANLRWAAAFAAPWVVRRVRRMMPGEGAEPKSWTLTEVT